MFTVVELKSYRDDRLIETEINAGQLACGFGDGSVYHAVGFSSQLCFSYNKLLIVSVKLYYFNYYKSSDIMLTNKKRTVFGREQLAKI